MITLKFFAQCADQVGQRQKTVPAPAGAFWTPRRLLDAAPELGCLKREPHLKVAVNQSWAEWDSPLQDGDEVAFLPPVSGG